MNARDDHPYHEHRWEQMCDEIDRLRAENNNLQQLAVAVTDWVAEYHEWTEWWESLNDEDRAVELASMDAHSAEHRDGIA